MGINFDRTVFEQATQNLQLAEEKRKKRRKRLQHSVRYTFPAMVGTAFFIYTKTGFRWVVLFVILYVVFYALALMFNNSASKIDYKQIFLTPVLAHLFPLLRYKPLDYHPMKVFDKSNLYPGSYDNFLGDDLFTGTIEGRELSFSDLKVSRHSRNSANWNYNTILFKGIFVTATIPNMGESSFIVEPRSTAEPGKSLIVKAIRKLQPHRTEPSALTGYPTFDSTFQLLTHNLGQTMQQLTVRRMELILALDIEFDNLCLKYPQNELDPGVKPAEKITVALSVNNDQLYMGIRNVQLFDLPFDSNLTHSEVLFQKSVELIRLIELFVTSW